MDLTNEQAKHANITYACSAIIGKTAGECGYLLLSLPTIRHLQPPIVTLPTEACSASTQAQYTSMTIMNSLLPPLKNDKTE